jgi:biotin carboxyl carrier protein
MAKHLKITVEGKVYDVVVEDMTEDAGSTFYQTSMPAPSRSQAPSAPASSAPSAPSAAPAAAPAAGSKDKVSPLGGVILEISVKVGEKVTAGQQVALLEAMKMKTVVAADHDGTVSNIMVKPGDTVDSGQPLMTIE